MFKKQKEETSFYEWLLKNTSYIEDYELLKNICDLFDLKHCNMALTKLTVYLKSKYISHHF
jgi:hypothetical protein